MGAPIGNQNAAGPHNKRLTAGQKYKLANERKKNAYLKRTGNYKTKKQLSNIRKMSGRQRSKLNSRYGSKYFK